MTKVAGYRQRALDGREVRQLRRELASVRNEKRAGAEAGSVIRGMSAVFYRADDPGSEYWLWDDMVERLLPGCFDRAISESHDARALFNHDSSLLLGRVSSGTCRLAVDDVGLSYEIDADPTDPDHQRVAAKIDRGDVTGSSFAFIARQVRWTEQKLDDGSWLMIREILDVDLYDVGPVTWPAYAATTAGRDASERSGQAVAERAGLLAECAAQLRPADDDAVAMRLRLLSLDN